MTEHSSENQALDLNNNFVFMADKNKNNNNDFDESGRTFRRRNAIDDLTLAPAGRLAANRRLSRYSLATDLNQ